ELVHIDPRAGWSDRAQAEQLPDFGDGLAAPVGNRALTCALQLENPRAGIARAAILHRDPMVQWKKQSGPLKRIPVVSMLVEFARREVDAFERSIAAGGMWRNSASHATQS